MNKEEAAKMAALEARVAKLEQLLAAALQWAGQYPMGKLILTRVLNNKVAP
jgi:hypothetical protein